MTPSNQSFLSQILHYIYHKNLPKGKSLHAQIIKIGKSSCTYLSNNLINFYAKCEQLDEANLAFEDIKDKDIVSWNSLINGYSQLGGVQNSFFVMELFNRMRREAGLFPDAHTFVGIFAAASVLLEPFGGQQVHSLAMKMGSCDDVFVGSCLVNLYCKLGLVYDARKVFDRMPERNSVTWATMISGYAMEGFADYAVGLFKMIMWEGGECVNEFVFTSVLSAFTYHGFVDIGKQIHGLVIKFGFSSVGNAVVTMYTKCGSLDDAMQAFKLVSDKTSVTWTAMITGFTQCGEYEKALILFSEMHLSRTKASESTFVGVLNACSDSGSAEAGKQVHGYIVKLGLESRTYIMTALVGMYAKSGCVGDARQVDFLQEPDIVLWTSMIGSHIQNGEAESAIDLYCQMQIGGILPNELTMARVLKACSIIASLEQGKQIHAHTIKFGFGLEVPIGSALMTMYAKCGSFEDVMLIFKRMPAKDVVSWNSMISGLSQNGHGDEALQLFEEMLLEGTTPDSVTFNHILTACSHRGIVEKARIYFKMMSDDYNIVPRVEHFACKVDILSRAGKLYEAKDLIETVTFDHGPFLWRILLSACRNYHYYELGAYAGEKLMELHSEESSAYVLLSGIYNVLGRRDDVERVRRLMNLRGVTKVHGCSWINLKNHVHVFVVGDQLHPQIEEIRFSARRLSMLLKDEGYEPASDVSLMALES